MIKTRFAPSPTGYLHIGGVRTALYAWAFARHHRGKFVLRIEDTDRSRSTVEATQVILDSLEWLGLNYDDGPFYQTKRMDRYNSVIADLLERNIAYRCYMSLEELDSLREQQRQDNIKPRYDGRWRPENRNRLGLTEPSGVKPVIRFRNPDSGFVKWNDLIKGEIIVNNEELDDFVIARQDGTPTYNFCVVVDDWDMEITHVIRGDDHVNNTPKQINLLNALNAPVPEYGHLSTICGSDGQKLSKRSGAISVLQYRDNGYMPDALINYLSRLGWSHGNDEIFSRQQLIEWFDLTHVSKVPAQFDPEKLLWLNQHYLHNTDTSDLTNLVIPFLEKLGISVEQPLNLNELVALNKSRAKTIAELAEQIVVYYAPKPLQGENLSAVENEKTQHILKIIADELLTASWKEKDLSELIKKVAKENSLKLHEAAIPLRLCLLGTPKSAPFGQVLEVLGRDISQQRIGKYFLKN